MLLRLIDVVHGDVQMHLLWRVYVWPARRPKVGRQLEGQAGAISRVTDDDPMVVVLHPDKAEEFLVERR